MDKPPDYLAHMQQIPRIEVDMVTDESNTDVQLEASSRDYSSPLPLHSPRSSPHLSWERRRLYLPTAQQTQGTDDGLHLNTIPETGGGTSRQGHTRSRSSDLGQARPHLAGSEFDVYPPRPARSSLDLSRLSGRDTEVVLQTGRSIVRNASVDNLLQSEDLRGRLNRIANRSKVKMDRMHSFPSVSRVQEPLAIDIPFEGMSVQTNFSRHWSLPDTGVHAPPLNTSRNGPEQNGDYVTVEGFVHDVPSAVPSHVVTDKTAKDDHDSGRGSEVTSVQAK